MDNFKGFLQEDFLTELHGSISGGESYKAVSHFRDYVAPFLKKSAVKSAKQHIERYGDPSKIEVEDGKYSDNKHSHLLGSKVGVFEKGTKVKVKDIHHIDGNGKIFLNTHSHGVIPQSALAKPEHLKRENKSKKGFEVESIIAKNLGVKAAGPTGSSYDYYYGHSNGHPTVRGKVVETESEQTQKKSDGTPTVAGESKLSNSKMGAGNLKFTKGQGWRFESKLKEFEKHMNKHATVNGVPLIEHMNKHFKSGTITKGFTIDAPKGTARSYLRSGNINSLHVHDKKTNKGTTFTVGDKNELKGKTKLGHLSNYDLDKHLDGTINVEKSLTGTAAVYHRPNQVKMRHLASLSTTDVNNHRDLTNAQHAGEFRRHIDDWQKSQKKVPVMGLLKKIFKSRVSGS